jgi:hypothetical protein
MKTFVRTLNELSGDQRPAFITFAADPESLQQYLL